MPRWTPRITTSVISMLCGVALLAGCATGTTSGPSSTWLMQGEGSGGSGGFFATHPATGDRIEALRKL